MDVFRLVQVDSKDDVDLVESFRSSRELGRKPRGREVAVPETHESLSVYKQLEQARDLWRVIAAKHPNPRIGNWVAHVRLPGGEGFAYEDLDEPDGHMEVWGEPVKFVRAVVEIYEAG